MSDHRAFRGVWIPADIWMNRDLSLQEKVMLIEIDSLQHPDRGCFKTNKSLAEFFGLSPSRVSEIVTSLAKKGWVRVELIRDGRQIVERRIFMASPLAAPIRDPEEGYSENGENPIRNPEEGYSENASERGSGVRGSDRGVKEKPSSPSGDVVNVFEHWREVMGKTKRSVLDGKRQTLIKNALKNYNLKDVKTAITGCSMSRYHMGDNPNGKLYNELGLILRNAEKIEQFIGYAERPPATVHSITDGRARPKHHNLTATTDGLERRADGTYSL